MFTLRINFCYIWVVLLHDAVSDFVVFNSNNIYYLQFGCHPVAVVILHVYKT
jgi:hypothetical protein